MATTTTPTLGNIASAFTPTMGQLAGQEQTLSSWAAPYVTNMLGAAQGLAQSPYQTYQGPLTAGYSPLQQQAFQGLGGLGTPSALTDAAATAGGIASKLQGSTFAPTQFDAGFQAPAQYNAAAATNTFTGAPSYTAGQFSSGYTAAPGYSALAPTNQYDPTAGYTAGQFSSNFQAPVGYSEVGKSFTSPGVASQYMNPYLQEALDPTLKELRRQSDISRLTDAGRLTQAGAYGGSRQAIMESEGRRNLLDQISRTTGEGYSRAYDSAAGQFNTEQAKRIQEAQFGAGQNLQSAQLAAQFGQSAQQMGEQSRQFGAQQALQNAQNRAQYGLAGLQIGEQSRQFGAQQAANAASEAAKFGQSAQQMGEQSRQFGAQQGLTAADMAARYGLAGLQLGEQSRQFGAQQGLTAADMAARYGLASQQAAEQSKQYGAGFGLDALTKGLSAAQLQGSLGMNMADVQRQNVLSQLYGGAQQREVDQAGVAADLAEFEKQRAYPMEMLKFQQAMLQNMPISAENRTYNEPSELSQVLTGAGGLAQLYDILYPKTTPTTTTP